MTGAVEIPRFETVTRLVKSVMLLLLMKVSVTTTIQFTLGEGF